MANKLTLKTENTISDSAVLDVESLGGFLLRNNSGVDTSRARPVRYGLGNDSRELCRIRKSSDRIGCVPVLIGPQHLGMTLGVLLAVEAKREGWAFNPKDDRAVAQLNFINQVNQAGGCGFFLNNTDILKAHVKNILKI